MPSTYEPIATTTLVSTNSTITFTSIPGTYTDLVCVLNGRTTGTVRGINIASINSDGGSNYSGTILQGSSGGAGSDRNSSQTSANIALLDDGQSNSIFNFMNYSNTTTYKTILARGNAPTRSFVRAAVGLWRNTAAITSFSITIGGDDFTSGTTATLYGIKSA
jgi:hypothetical protein